MILLLFSKQFFPWSARIQVTTALYIFAINIANNLYNNVWQLIKWLIMNFSWLKSLIEGQCLRIHVVELGQVQYNN